MYAALPVIMPLFVGICLLFSKNKKSVELVHLLGTVVVLLSSLVFLIKAQAGYDDFWLYDALSKYFVAVITIVYFMASIFSVRYLLPEYKEGKINLSKLKYYYFWLHVFASTMFLTVLLNNVGLMWVAIELTTLTSALLVGFYNNKASLEAAWKYIFLCSVGIGIALFGIIIVFYATENVLGNHTDALNWTKLLVSAKLLNLSLLKLAFVFIVVGLGTKVGLAPMHAWLPDAHSQAPSPVSAMLSGVLLNCALYGVLRFQIILNAALGDKGFTSEILIFFGALSLLVSLPFIIVQTDIKRLLAYSSIEHMGLITLAFGIGSKLAVLGGILHILFHALAKTAMFFAAGDVANSWGTRKIARIKGIFNVMPLQGWALFLALFALTGSPPFGLFRSEFMILQALVQNQKWLLAITLLAALVTAFAGLVYHFGKMVTGTTKKVRFHESYRQPVFVLVPVVILLLFGLWVPDFLQNAALHAGEVLTGGVL